LPEISTTLTLSKTQVWKYETDEFEGVCEIAHDKMVVKCVFSATTNAFHDVLQIDKVIRSLLQSPVSVERLAEQLSDAMPILGVTVMGRAKTHGWITSTIPIRWG
jgi:hypothetical protein